MTGGNVYRAVKLAAAPSITGGDDTAYRPTQNAAARAAGNAASLRHHAPRSLRHQARLRLLQNAGSQGLALQRLTIQPHHLVAHLRLTIGPGPQYLGLAAP